jgi:hypothetical protein
MTAKILKINSQQSQTLYTSNIDIMSWQEKPGCKKYKSMALLYNSTLPC